MMSFTENPEIAKKYAILGGSTGEQVRNEIFDPSLTAGCNLTYDIEKHPADGPIFKSEAMEEKWDIYLYDEHLYFCRSWGGELIYRAAVKCEPPTLTVSEVAASHKDYEKNAIRDADFLIKSHLLAAKALHYLPAEIGRNTRELALFSFSAYGRLGRYGTFEETIGTPYFKGSVMLLPTGGGGKSSRKDGPPKSFAV
jgi:hypothetical protein